MGAGLQINGINVALTTIRTKLRPTSKALNRRFCFCFSLSRFFRHFFFVCVFLLSAFFNGKVTVFFFFSAKRKWHVFFIINVVVVVLAGVVISHFHYKNRIKWAPTIRIVSIFIYSDRIFLVSSPGKVALRYCFEDLFPGGIHANV